MMEKRTNSRTQTYLEWKERERERERFLIMEKYCCLFLGADFWMKICLLSSMRVCLWAIHVCVCVFAFYGAYTQCELAKYTYTSTCANISYSRLESTGRRLRLELRPLPHFPPGSQIPGIFRCAPAKNETEPNRTLVLPPTEVANSCPGNRPR